MNSSEYFFPIGAITLSKEQSKRIKTALGKELVSLPVFQVAPACSSDRFIPLLDVPGLVGMTLHYAPQSAPSPVSGGQLIASILDEMAEDAGKNRIFAAHTKLMAPRPDEKGIEPGKSE